MALTIREKILANLATVLATITTGNGYENTIGSVQRWKQNGNDFTTMPLILISAGTEVNDDDSFPLTQCRLNVILALWYRQPESDSTATDIALNSLLGDIKKALKVDVTRGGNAVDTQFREIEPFETVEGQPHAGLIINIEIHYRHQQTDPQQVG